jgi:hypothetical protein
MTPALARLLTRLYPRNWRARYGAEFEAFLIDGGYSFGSGIRGEIRAAANVLYAALGERIDSATNNSLTNNSVEGDRMDGNPNSFGAILSKPSALVPMAMSLAGPAQACFAVKWLPRAPKQTLCVIALQAAAVLASMAPVLYFKL